ncbi:helix-turn-helix domain-containing protein [Chryseobacterium jejuense]|uniref:helix-turn-helix domain-containing protein n=1 Tax=Chryseobacterium jejuense TaxID=445960 RepID=UPI001AE6D32F|nr:AraC family transcriptional regulator [Chryseobacterium jejuense]MBP2619718.1 AraC-like DNA-binding protein [Chryseobacterium jejuense]
MARIPEFKPDNFKKIINVVRLDTKSIFSDFLIEPLTSLNETAVLPSVPHRKTVNDFVFITKGELSKMVCSDVFVLKSGMLMLLPAYKIRTILKKAGNIEGYYGHFSNHFINDLSSQKKLKEISNYIELIYNPVFSFDKETTNRIQYVLQQLLLLYEKDTGNSLLKSYLNTLLNEIANFIQTLPLPVFSPKEALIQRFRRLIANNIQKTHKLQVYAEMLNITTNHLNKCAKSVTGKTSSAIINEALTMEAKALLSLSNHTISEAAFVLGFEDVSYFSRFFKKHSGLQPSEYRKMIDLS